MPVVLDPSQFILAAYNKPLVAKPVDICTTQKHQSKVVPVSINWVQFPSFAVSINLNQGTAGTTMDKMVGVFIDNADNAEDIVLIAPDTGQRLVCFAFQQTYFPIFSTTNIINIYNGQHVDLLGPKGNINLLFTNFPLNEFLNTNALPSALALFEGTSNVDASGIVNNNFFPPVLGDKHVDNTFDLSTTGNQSLIAAPPVAQGLIVVQNLQFAIFNCYNTTGTGPLQLIMGLSNGVGVLLQLNAFINHDDKYLPYTVIYSRGGLYELLNPVQIFFFNVVAIPGGRCHVIIDYTWKGI
jgi:hypothetical protein